MSIQIDEEKDDEEKDDEKDDKEDEDNQIVSEDLLEIQHIQNCYPKR